MKPTAGYRHQQPDASEQEQQSQQQAQRKPHMQIDKARTGRHPAAVQHQVEGGKSIAEGSHQRQHR